jgi:putative ABC transport system permease protein
MFQHDLRQAFRWLRSNPGFTIAALIVLALGVGAATATFTVIHAVILRPLPFQKPDRIIRIWSSAPGNKLPFFSVSPADVTDWRERATTLAVVAPYERQQPFTLTDDGVAEPVEGARVSRELFELLGVGPAIGRWFSSAEDRPGSAARVAVIGDGVWQRRFGGRADIIGQAVRIDNESWTVVGVMPRGFVVPNNPAEIWLPLRLAGDPARLEGRRLRVLARLREGASPEDATSELTRIADALAREHPKTNQAWSVTVRPLTETVVSESFRRSLLVAGGAVVMVLLVACANVASLLLSRATSRTREMAMRTALGAPRSALIRQMLTESLVLAIGGGFLGVLLAMWTLDALAALAVTTIPRADEISLRAPVLLFALAVTLVTAVVFGLVPAIGTSRSRLESLRARETSAGKTTSRARDALVVAEVAAAMVLLVGAGLMIRSFAHLQQRDLGFNSENLLLVDVVPPADAEWLPFYDAMRARLGALPGVTSSALGSSLPFAGPNSANTIAIEGRTFAAGETPDADFRAVSPDYFRTLGIAVVRGRTLGADDAKGSPGVVINATFARRFFEGEDPLGRRIRLGAAPWTTIVGIVADTRYMGLDEPRDDMRPMVYLLPEVLASRAMTIALKTAVPADVLVAAVRSAAAATSPRQPITRLEKMDSILADVLGPQRFSTTLLGAFAWMALVLAAAGLWGLIAHLVARRTREIGVRVALGARPSDVLLMTAGRGVVLAVFGIALGAAGASALTRVLQRVLFDVSATDPATFATIAMTFLVVAIGASVFPAFRALRIDPAEALRLE